MSCCYRESFFDNDSNIQYFYFTIKILYFYFMYRKHFFYLLFLSLTGFLVFGFEKFNVLNFNLSIFPIIVSVFTLLTLFQNNKRKRQIQWVKVLLFANTIYILKYIIFDSSNEILGYLYLAIITLLLALSLKSLMKDQQLVDSVNRLR